MKLFLVRPQVGPCLLVIAESGEEASAFAEPHIRTKALMTTELTMCQVKDGATPGVVFDPAITTISTTTDSTAGK